MVRGFVGIVGHTVFLVLLKARTSVEVPSLLEREKMPLFSFRSIFPSVKAEDEELVDPQAVLKESCAQKPGCMAFKQKLEECNERVSSRSQTTETCIEELIDFVHCVDHCVSKQLFAKLK